MTVSSQRVEEAGVVEAAVNSGSAPFKEAMQRFASGVTIVTTTDRDGRWHGFTASAFSSLSLDPPLVLVCQAHVAESYEAFMSCDRFLVNILGAPHEELALRFASKRADKFGEGNWRSSQSGLPLLQDALTTVGCDVHERYAGGDHTIYVGAVYYCHVRDGAPMLHFGRRFWDLTERAPSAAR